MDKESFLKLSIEEKVKVLNERLDDGVTVSQIRNEWKIPEKLLQRILKEGKYKFDPKTKRYKSSIDSYNYESNEVVVIDDENYNRSESVVVPKYEYESLTKKVDEMYEYFKVQSNIVEVQELKIPVNNNKAVTRSFKIYEDVLEEFTEYCRKHNNYKVQDIVTLALKNIMKDYK